MYTLRSLKTHFPGQQYIESSWKESRGDFPMIQLQMSFISTQLGVATKE